MKPPFTYFGGKQNLVKWIAPLIPTCSAYVEPFFGSGALLFAAQTRWAKIEIINDLNSDVVTFFRVLRDRPQDLIEKLQLFPFSREENRISTDVINNSDDEVQRALYFFARAEMSFGAKQTKNSMALPSIRHKKDTAGNWISKTRPDRLLKLAARLRNAVIENNPALKVLELYDREETFFYLDPPYLSVANAASMNAAYRGKAMSEDQHKELIDFCLNARGMFIISGYYHPVYDALTKAGWETLTKNVHVHLHPNSRTMSKEKDTARQEILWISPSVAIGQLTLW